MENSKTRFDRRTVLRGISASLLAGALAGCSGPGGEEEDEGDEEDGGGGEEEDEGDEEEDGDGEDDLRQPVAE